MSCPIKPVTALGWVDSGVLKSFILSKAGNYRHRQPLAEKNRHKTILRAKMFGSAEIRWQSK
jgi:hypothetical protein